MTYMQGCMPLQNEYMRQENDVYDLPRRVYGTLEGVWGDK